MTYFFITTGFGNSDAGAFNNTISGPGDIHATPEPSTFALLGAGVGLAALLRRRQ